MYFKAVTMYVFSKPAAWVTPPVLDQSGSAWMYSLRRPDSLFTFLLKKGGYVQYIFCQWEAERAHVCTVHHILCPLIKNLSKWWKNKLQWTWKRIFFNLASFVLVQRSSWENMCTSGKLLSSSVCSFVNSFVAFQLVQPSATPRIPSRPDWVQSICLPPLYDGRPKRTDRWGGEDAFSQWRLTLMLNHFVHDCFIWRSVNTPAIGAHQQRGGAY